jgi:S1-C subfamily serine protease
MSSRRVVQVLGGFVVLVAAILILQPYLGRHTSASETPEITPAGNRASGSQSAVQLGELVSAKPAPYPAAPLDTAQIAELATPSVVVVENYNEDGQKQSQGSGYIFATDGVVLTNYHVIRGATSLVVKIPGGGDLRTDSLVGYDPEHDVAAIKIEGTFHALRTDDSEHAKTGDHVVAIGAPLGLEHTVSDGIVSSVREVNGGNILQTTASISPGSSGGPLLNGYGSVIGLTTSQMLNGQNLNFVISSKRITDLIAHQHSMELSQMLAETFVSDSLPASTLTVPARQASTISFVVTGQQGALLEGGYFISGGNNDVGVALIAAPSTMVVNSGRVASAGQFRQRLTRGSYSIIFDNRLSTFTPKSISANLKLIYYK